MKNYGNFKIRICFLVSFCIFISIKSYSQLELNSELTRIEHGIKEIRIFDNEGHIKLIFEFDKKGKLLSSQEFISFPVYKFYSYNMEGELQMIFSNYDNSNYVLEYRHIDNGSLKKGHIVRLSFTENGFASDTLIAESLIWTNVYSDFANLKSVKIEKKDIRLDFIGAGEFVSFNIDYYLDPNGLIDRISIRDKKLSQKEVNWHYKYVFFE